jgi:protein O-GlcNAc transferase
VGNPNQNKKAADSAVQQASELLRKAAALRQQGQPEAALSDLRHAALLAPLNAEAHHQVGNVLKGLGRFAEAAVSLRRACALAPSDSVVLLNLGVALLETGDFDGAVESIQRAVRLEPGRPEAHNLLGHALLSAGRLTDAISALEAALLLRPGYAAPHDNLGRALKAQGRTAEAIRHHRAALAAAPSPGTHSNLLYSLNFVDLDPKDILAEHVNWGSVHGGSGPATSLVPARGDEARRLRVGYVSPDFVNHAVSYFFAPVLAHHDRARFEVFCYSSVRVPDRVTERLRAMAEHWRDVAGSSDADLAAQIRNDGIDILVDLSGHTAHNRLLVFARRPAPVQVTWLGYPNTSGLGAMDYRITDSMSDPPGFADGAYTEKLVRLPGTFSCYEPSPQSPDVGPLPAARTGSLTFGCFNNFAKVTPGMITLWGQVLVDSPGSRLLLKSNGLSDPDTRDLVLRSFATAGVGRERLELDGQVRSVADHLALYHRMDIALDTHPYNGATTTCEALWMGVPVVTLAGRTHASRVGASFLTQVGLASLVASSLDGYRRACRELASDLTSLSGLRSSLRERMRGSTLCDGALFTRRLEDAFGSMARDAQSAARG